MFCTKCGAQMADGARFCPSCGNPVSGENPAMAVDGGKGYLKIYRMGNPMGIALDMGIYLNGEPAGNVANKKTVTLAVNPGTYKIHMVLGMNRKCNDPVVTVAAGQTLCFKVHMRMGMIQNTMVLEQCTEADMPE